MMQNYARCSQCEVNKVKVEEAKESDRWTKDGNDGWCCPECKKKEEDLKWKING